MKEVTIGILCNSMTFLKWQADLIHAVHRNERCHVRGFIFAENVDPHIARPSRNWSQISWKVACKIEALLYPPSNIDADERIDIGGDFAQTPKLSLKPEPEPTPLENRLRQTDINMCRELDCDIFINFGVDAVHEDLLSIPRMGIWTYHLTDTRVNKGTPPGFWEFYYDDPVTGVTLRRSDPVGCKVLARGFYRTNRYSWTRNAESVSAKGSHLLMDKIAELCMFGNISSVDEAFANIYAGRCRTSPNMGQCLAAITKLMRRSAALLLYKLLFRQVWELIISKNSRAPVELGRSARIRAPQGRFWADPFIVERQDGMYIFLEEYKFKSKRGEIGVIKVEDTKTSSCRIVISAEYHFSFPYIFKYEDQLFMCPETSQNRSVELWKCEKFPDAWKKDKVLLANVSAADTVIFEHSNKWWLFTNIDRSEHGDHCYELWAFYSDHPIDGPWLPHRRNPLVVDTRCARNAGKVRWYDGVGLVRFSQINIGRYGSGIDIRRITRLDEECYSEESVRRLCPIWDSDLTGLHHCDMSENYVVVDVCRRRFRLLS